MEAVVQRCWQWQKEPEGATPELSVIAVNSRVKRVRFASIAHPNETSSLRQWHESGRTSIGCFRAKKEKTRPTIPVRILFSALEIALVRQNLKGMEHLFAGGVAHTDNQGCCLVRLRRRDIPAHFATA
jgi:hypothetical protein